MSRGSSRATSASTFRTVSRAALVREQSPSELHDSVDGSMPRVERTLQGPRTRRVRGREPTIATRSSSSATDAAGAHLAAASPTRMPARPRPIRPAAAARSAMNAPSPVTTAVRSPGCRARTVAIASAILVDLRRGQRIGNRRDTRLVHHLSIGADGARETLASELARGRATIGRRRRVVGRLEIASPDVHVTAQRKSFGRKPHLSALERHGRRPSLQPAFAPPRSRQARPKQGDRDRSIRAPPLLHRRWE